MCKVRSISVHFLPIQVMMMTTKTAMSGASVKLSLSGSRHPVTNPLTVQTVPTRAHKNSPSVRTIRTFINDVRILS